MKIGIIGGGSIGLLLAHYLKKHHQVCVYVRSKRQLDVLEAEGLIFEKDKNCIKEAINVSLFSKWNGEEELTILAVKQYQLPPILEKMAASNTNVGGSLLFLQNGMGHLKWLEGVNAKNIFVGTVEHGANKVAVNHVIHTGEGLIKLALYRGDNLTILTDMVKIPVENFPFIFEEDYQEMLLNKLIVNAVINPLTAALNVNNGMLLENPHYYYIFKEIFNEISSVLSIVDKENTFYYVENICRKTSLNRSSMLKDLDENRPTEIDAILGYVIEKARERQMNAPFSESFYHLIKGKEYGEGRK